MAKFWATCLVIFVAAWAFVPSLDYLCELSEIAREARLMLKNGEGTVVKFAQKTGADFGFRWVNDREFWHGGQLFDVQKMERHGDSLFVFAQCDEREQRLHADFEEQFDKKRKGQNPLGHRFWKCWLDHPFVIPADGFLLKTGFLLLKSYGNGAEWGFSAPGGPPLSPPPERFS